MCITDEQVEQLPESLVDTPIIDMVKYPDIYELDNELEDFTNLGKRVIASTNATCPRCESNNTDFGTSLNYDLMWHCQDCGIVFSIEMKLLFDSIRDNDK
jgi:transposase-like protein